MVVRPARHARLSAQSAALSAVTPSPLDRVTAPGGNGTTHKRGYPGHFLDLRTLAFALTDRSHSLRTACDAFDVEHGKVSAERHGAITPDYIDYNLRDVLATWELYCRTREEFERHPIELAPTKAYSPASVGKAYLEAMGIKESCLISIEQADAAGRDHQFEYRMRAADGRIVWVRDIVTVVKDDAGQPAFLRGVMIDVTERKVASETAERLGKLRLEF